MRRCLTSSFAGGAVVALLAAGCCERLGPPWTGEGGQSGLERLAETSDDSWRQPNQDLPLRLLAFPLQRVVAAGKPVKVLLLLENLRDGPLWVRFRFDLQVSLEATVRRPSGEPVSSHSLSGGWEPYVLDDRLTLIPLPRNGVIGRILNLSCDVTDYSEVDEGGGCSELFSFAEPGAYSLRFRYQDAWACEVSPCEPPQGVQGDLSTDPVEILVSAGGSD